MLKRAIEAVSSWFASAEEESPVLADARPDLAALATELRQQAERRQPRIQPPKREQRERASLPAMREAAPDPEVARRQKVAAEIARNEKALRQAEVHWRESALSPAVTAHRPAAMPRLQRDVPLPSTTEAKRISTGATDKAREQSKRLAGPTLPPVPRLPPPEAPQAPMAVAVPKAAAKGKRPAKAKGKRRGGKRKAGPSDATPKMQPRLAAAAWLGQRVKDGPVDYAAIKTEAPKAGHSLRTLDRAAALIDVESVEIGGGRTVWQMRPAR